ncbi:MAG: S9 family peptidase [Deltaproteobacteria bacterium]|nr:S9 family peptidase [Deltaproteobacteria bacterium]
MHKLALALAGVLAAASPALAQDATTYQRPGKAVANFVDAQGLPIARIAPDKRTLLLVTAQTFPSIAEVAEVELRLAGLRINPKNRAQSRRFYAQKLELLDARTPGAAPRAIRGLPDGARMADLAWSPDGKYLALSVTDATAIKLWLVDIAAATAKQIGGDALSGVFGNPCEWLPSSAALVCRLAPRGAAAPPVAATVPAGPVIQENDGAKKPARTNPDLLATPNDEKLFEYHAASQLALVALDGTTTPFGRPGLYLANEPSPDGRSVLVRDVHRPFSYRVAADAFPTRTEVWDLTGKRVASIADLPLAETIPSDFDAVRTGRRAIDWRADAPSTVCWAEAQDGGDPKKPAPVRDVVSCAAAPAYAAPVAIAKLPLRFQSLSWSGGASPIALVGEGWWKDRKTRTYVVAPDDARRPQRILWDRSSEDRYGDPGAPVMRREPNGQWVLHRTSKGHLLLLGEGASAEGDRPFFDRLDLATGKSERIWRSDGKQYAVVREVLDADGDEVILQRESPTEPPQLFVQRFYVKGGERQLTRFQHPVPELAKVTKQLIKWKRKDGLELSGMLYLPAGFRPKVDAPLPVLVWVYPQEFKTAAAASQVNDSPYRFVHPWWGGPLFALTQGYAVVDDPAFAIVGEGKTEPNDTYVEQLTADAQSMIDHVVGMGVGDRARFAVAGHSYGAFTTANLLAHTNLFAAGIARSGAYNRTLTPFGFQAEERTYWEAATTYDRMSPFRFADKIDEPLLLVHGAADNNPGTFPIQSDRLFAAMQGLGGRVRYVSLPAESHGYRARESALHVLWEQVRWLDMHVKNRKRPGPPRR